MSELLAELFSSRVRAAVLTLVLSRPHLAFSLTDLSRRLGLPVSSVQHECYKLTRLGLLRDERAGNARLYRPSPGWPLLEPLTALTVRAMPLEEALRGAVERVPGIEHAWIAGDLTTGAGAAYVVIVGNLDVEGIDGVFARSRVALTPFTKPELIELAYFRSGDWDARMSAGDPFAAALLTERRIVLCGLSGEPNGGVASGA